MKNIEIKILLGKYFEGETSLQEEKTLQYYFLCEDVTADLLEYKYLFAAFRDESYIAAEPIDQHDVFKGEKTNNLSLVRNTSWAIAATVALLMGSWFFFQQHVDEQKIPSHQELMIAQKYLHQSLVSFNKAYNESNKLLRKTMMIEQNKMEVARMGEVYNNNTQEILKLEYFNKSLERLNGLSNLKKSRIKLIM